jgi:hypothetical protein
MKLGIAFLIIGLILSAIGVALWIGASPNSASLFFGSSNERAAAVDIAKGAGIGLTIFGGGLAIGGVIRMIVMSPKLLKSEYSENTSSSEKHEQVSISEKSLGVGQEDSPNANEQTADKISYCSKCGAKVTSDDAFCPKCGNRLSN